MTKDDIFAKIVDILQQTFDIEPSRITRESRLGEDLDIDSIDALELGLALQKRYGVSLSAESEEVRAHFASVKTLAAFVIAQGKA